MQTRSRWKQGNMKFKVILKYIASLGPGMHEPFFQQKCSKS